MTTEAQNEALARLVRQGVLTAEQAIAVRDALHEAEPRSRARWAEVAGYVGGGLLLAGALSLAATSWADLSRPAHIAILVAATAALLAAGMALIGTRGQTTALIGGRPREQETTPIGGRPRDQGTALIGSRPREQATTVRGRSGSVSAALASVTAALAAAEIAHGHALPIAAATGLAVAVAGYALARTTPGVLACAFFAALTAGSLADDLSDGSALATGLSLIGAGIVWTALVLAGVIGRRRLGLGLGAAIALLGGQLSLGYEPWAYATTFAVAVACLVLYRREREWVLLVAGVGGFTLAVPEAIWDWTGGAVGGSFIVMIAGAVLVTASVLGIRWHRTAHPDDRTGRES